MSYLTIIPKHLPLIHLSEPLTVLTIFILFILLVNSWSYLNYLFVYMLYVCRFLNTMQTQGAQAVSLPWHYVPHSRGFSPYNTLFNQMYFFLIGWCQEKIIVFINSLSKNDLRWIVSRFNSKRQFYIISKLTKIGFTIVDMFYKCHLQLCYHWLNLQFWDMYVWVGMHMYDHVWSNF